MTRLLRAAPQWPGLASQAVKPETSPVRTQALRHGNFITMQLGHLALPGLLEPCLPRDTGSSPPGPGRWVPWAFGSLLSLSSSFSTMSLLFSSFTSSLPLCGLSFSLFFSSPLLFHPALLSPPPFPLPQVSHLPPVFLFPPLSNSPLVEDLPKSAPGLPDQLPTASWPPGVQQTHPCQ